MQLIITHSPELKELVVQEIQSLGATVTEQGNYSTTCTVPDDQEEIFYKLHLYNSLADQIHLHLKTFSAKTPEMIFDQVRRIRWHEILPNQGKHPFAIEFSNHENAPVTFQKVFQGIADSLRHFSKVDAQGDSDSDVIIIVHQDKKRQKISLSLNTSGRTLHKRGYRCKGHPAPLKENKARALLHFAGYTKAGETQKICLWDPFCGSGTIAIEAAMFALGKAAHIHRSKDVFSFEKLPLFNRNVWRKVQDEARMAKQTEIKSPIWATDISKDYIELSKRNALKARVEKYILWKDADFFTIEPPRLPSDVRGMIISNLPYDARLSVPELEEFYRRLGAHIKQNFKGWQIHFLVAADTPWKAIGLRPTFEKNFKNGAIECKFVRYDIFANS